ncbi:hypothetical protein CONCODRAFT_70856 [Conidiobolus coronatus NRRL 28638]|uniref:Uncharacterized protein n=1 Tax=Conidiobolus coronatus (strain ATCC 28846 / CBS 209.66 / NRRL 28638) TaxID=796925 RepID=A0A137P5D7_CONC2|nr:hypothetical protein CONCODRAFT_70856 [Conidiobolus coronatus NRRL 28638]|eukprot:KXN70217.1 hypothetical protein CONCODRAFT_70856 [Conidiobolus coronatus NRRL 28638]
MNFEDYNFDEDENFKKGLSSILATFKQDNTNEEEAILKAKQFYFEKVIKPRQNTESSGNSDQQPATSGEDHVPRLSLKEITDLISSGQPIPGIKTIPLKINEEEPKSSTLTPRKKPWEH